MGDVRSDRTCPAVTAPPVGLATAVVLPVLNGEATIAGQLERLAAEEWPDRAGLVVVDDGSTDGTRAVVESFRTRLPGLWIVDGPRVGSPGRATDHGVAVTDATKIIRVDHDDLVEPGYVGAMDRALDHHDLVAAELRFEDLRPADRRPRPPQRVAEVMDFLPAHPTCGLGFRREVWDRLGGFRPEAGRLDDVDFCWRAQEAGFDLADAPGAAVQYRQRSGARAVFVEGYRSGQVHAELLRHHRPHGMTWPPRRTGLLRTLKVVRNLPVRSRGADRTEWAARAGRQAGRVRGSLRYRIWAL